MLAPSPLPPNFYSFPVLEAVSAGFVGAYLSTNKRAVDAVDFDGGGCAAVLCPGHDSGGAAGVGLRGVCIGGRIDCDRDGIR